jgi:hypothetical protein
MQAAVAPEIAAKSKQRDTIEEKVLRVLLPTLGSITA